jgi:hypothetical protein
MKAKRQGAYIAALLMFFLSVFPAKNSDAIGFFLIPLVMGVTVSTGLGVGAFCEIESCFTPSKAANSQVLSVEIRPSDGKPAIRLPTTSNAANTAVAMPPPSAPSSAASVSSGGKPSNSATVSAYRSTYDEFRGTWSSGVTDPTLDQCLTNFVANLPGRRCVVNSPTAENNGVGYGNCTTGCTPVTPTTSCPSGYTLSGGSCTLSDARAAVADGKSDLSRNSSGFSDNGDKDGVPSYGSINNGKVVAYGSNSKGEPVVFSASVDASGHTTLSTQTQTTSAGGQSVVKTSSYTLDSNSGQVLAQSSSSASGNVDYSSGKPVVNSGSSVNPSEGLGFPSDYARAGEAAQAANTIKTSVDQLKDRLTDSAAVGDPEAPQYTNHWGDTFTGLLSWSLPSHTSSCPVATFDAFEQTFRMDSHCQLAADHWTVLQGAMVVAWVILAMYIILGA